MGMNLVVLNGRLPHFDPTSYTQGDGTRKSFLTWSLSVQRNYKKPEDKNYPTDLFKFKAFGATADFIMNQFSQGDGLILTGSLQIEDDYTDKDGNERKGQVVLNVSSVSFADAKSIKDNTAAPTKPAGKPAIPGKPQVPSKPGLPGKLPVPAKPKFPGR